jgi:hypothetical protein
MSERESGERADRSGGIITGLFLIVLGGLFLASRIGGLDLGPVWQYWPLLVIFFGVSKLVSGRSGAAIGGGVFMTVIGLWFLAVQFEWYGLDYSNSWPLALVAVGGSMVTRALVGDRGTRPRRGGEDGHGTP